MKSPVIALLFALLAAGCQSTPPYGQDSPHYAYPGNLRLIQLKPLEIPPGAATVRLQFGRVVARNGVQEIEPHCIFELDTVRDGPQAVLPDHYRVTAVQRRIQTFAGMPVPPHYRMKVGFGHDDSPSHVYFITEFRLRSDRQPQIRALTCQSNQMAPGIAIMRHLTLAEIRAALGDHFRLDLPG